MDRPSDSQRPGKNTAKGPKQKGPAQKAPVKETKPSEDSEYTLLFVYLVLYNWVSAILWAAILGRVLLTTAIEGHEKVYENVGELVKYTQTLAATEALNASFGIVRANFFTTVLQVASRFVLVWLVTELFPQETTPSPAYASMLIAWSLTEAIRYSYFTMKIAFGEVSGVLQWLRYNTFVVLYPIGILSEIWLIILAIEPAKKIEWMHVSVDKHLWAILSAYAPGSWVLFTHMMQQRKKVLNGSDKKKTT